MKAFAFMLAGSMTTAAIASENTATLELVPALPPALACEIVSKTTLLYLWPREKSTPEEGTRQVNFSRLNTIDPLLEDVKNRRSVKPFINRNPEKNAVSIFFRNNPFIMETYEIDLNKMTVLYTEVFSSWDASPQIYLSEGKCKNLSTEAPASEEAPSPHR